MRAAVGYIGGRDIVLGDVKIRVTKATEDWAAVAIGALDGKPLAESSRILVVAAGRVENVNMGWNESRTSISDEWGSGPVLAEGIEATIHLPSGARVAALDGAGQPERRCRLRADHRRHRVRHRAEARYVVVRGDGREGT